MSPPTAPANDRLTFDHVNRRLHLYLGLFLLPWLFVYGVSSLVFSHPAWFSEGPGWTVIFERNYQLDAIPANADLRPIRDRIVKDAGFEGHFGVFRTPEGWVRMYGATFLAATQITYDPQKRTLQAQRSPWRLSGLLGRIHTRGGFEDPRFLQTAWSIIVDLVQAAIVLWIVSGIYMWWRLRSHRLWGALALGAGAAAFAGFMLRL